MTATTPLDLRLVPAAVGAAGAAALVVVVAPGGATLVAVVAAALAVVCARASRWPTCAAAAGQAVLVLLVGAAVLLAGAAQVVARAVGELEPLARERATVHVAGTVRSDPVAVAESWPGQGARYRVALAVDMVRARGGEARAAAPITVIGGEGWSDIEYGSRIAAEGRLAVARPGDRAVAMLAASSGPILVTGPPSLLVGVADIRSGLVDIATDLPGDAGRLLPGVAVGDTSRVPDDLASAMRVSGLTHLTAVSGAHFALVGASVLAAANALSVRRPVRVVVVVVVLAGFVMLVRPGPSVLRAAAMGALGVGGLVVGRPSRALSALAAGVVVLLVADPWLVREIGFLLSVAATVGLVLLAAPLAARWSGAVGGPVAYALAVPVAAQCACAPLLVLLDPTVATYAVPANVLADPAVAPATVFGLLAALVAPWWSGGATLLAEVAGAACWWIGYVARTAAALPGAQLTWPEGVPGALLLAVGTAAALGLGLARGGRSARVEVSVQVTGLDPASDP